MVGGIKRNLTSVVIEFAIFAFKAIGSARAGFKNTWNFA